MRKQGSPSALEEPLHSDVGVRPLRSEPEPSKSLDTFRCYIPSGDSGCIWYEVTCEGFQLEGGRGTTFYNVLEDGTWDIVGFCPPTWGWRKK